MINPNSRAETVETIERRFNLVLLESPAQLTTRRSFVVRPGAALMTCGCASQLDPPVCILVDAIRNSTAIASLIALGAEEVLLFRKDRIPQLMQAAAEFKNQGRRVLFAGETEGGPLPGFDLGNSPIELSACPDRIPESTICFASTNGGAAAESLLTAAEDAIIFLGTFFNFEMIADLLAATEKHVIFLNGGFRDGASLEDIFVSGLIIDRLLRLRPDRRRLDTSAFMAFNAVQPFIVKSGKIAIDGRERMLTRIRAYSRVAEVLDYFGHAAEVEACVTGKGLSPSLRQALTKTVPASNCFLGGGALFLPHDKVQLPTRAGNANLHRNALM